MAARYLLKPALMILWAPSLLQELNGLGNGGAAAQVLARSTVATATTRLVPNPASSELGKRIAIEAETLAVQYRRSGYKNIYGGGQSPSGLYSDCSHFVHDAIERAMRRPVRYVSTSEFVSGHSPQGFIELTKGEMPQLGDVIVQSAHMAIYVGEKNGAVMGAQLASKGGPSVRAFGVKGYFPHPEDLRFYRVDVSAL